MTTENLDEKAGLPVGNNDNAEPAKEVQKNPEDKGTAPSSKAGLPVGNNDNAEPIQKIKEKEYSDDEEDDSDEDEISIDDSKEKKKVMEQEVPKFELSKDISSLLESIEFPAEFKEKALTIFEAAVAGQVADLHKVMLEKNEVAMEEYKKELSEKVETASTAYMTEAVEKWVEQNQVAIKSNVRTQIAESFMANLIELLETHYISVPEGKEDILDEALSKVESLEKELSEKVLEVSALKEQAQKQEKEKIFESATKELTDVQKERVATLAESIKDEDVEVYQTKLDTIITSLKESVKPSEHLTTDVNGEVDSKANVVAEDSDEYSHIKSLSQYLI